MKSSVPWSPYRWATGFAAPISVAAASAAWCSREEYRGYALQLIDEYFSQPVDLFVSTTVGPAAVLTLSQFYGPIPLGSWDTTSYFVTSHVAFARRALEKYRVGAARALAYPLGCMLSIKDALFHKLPPDCPAGVTIEIADDFDDRFDSFWSELVRQNPDKLLAERSSRALSWHFHAAIRSKRLWIFTASKAARLSAYCIFRQQSAAGGQSMCLIDYQSIEQDAYLLPGFLRKALRRCTQDGFYILQNFGVGVPKMRVFDDYAPYRGKLPNSVFYYTADPRIDTDLKHPDVWDPSLFDGDAAL